MTRRVHFSLKNARHVFLFMKKNIPHNDFRISFPHLPMPAKKKKKAKKTKKKTTKKKTKRSKRR